MKEEFLTIPVVAEYLGESRQYVWQQCKNGTYRNARKVGRDWLIPLDVLRIHYFPYNSARLEHCKVAVKERRYKRKPKREENPLQLKLFGEPRALRPIHKRILNLLRALRYQPLTASEMGAWLDANPRYVAARLRDLRREEYGGHRIDCSLVLRPDGSLRWVYRIKD